MVNIHTAKWPAKLAIFILIVTIFPWDYAIYMLAKIPISIIGFYYCYKNYKKDHEQIKEFWYFLIIGILFNPILPVHLFFSPLWVIADIICIVFLINYLRRL